MTIRRPGPAAAATLVAAVVALCISSVAVPAGAAAPEWNIDRIGAPASAPGALIAVVDTGVDASHPAFTGRVQPAIDLIGGSGGDPNGHGTHVAGTAAGADTGCGAIGVAPDARILPVRVLDEDGAGYARDVAEGIRRAADAGATVINLSLGTDVALRNLAGSGLEDAIRYAWSKGSIPVLAAGNDGLVGDIFGGSGYGDLPAVVVTATDHRDQAPSYATSIGSAAWGIAAPGGDDSGVEGRDILSAFPDRRCALHAGTSMAAPHVSGALAALRATGLGPQQAVDRLLETARPLGSSRTYGHGLVDLRAALATPAPAPTPVPTTATSASAPPPAPVATAVAPPARDPQPTTTAPEAVETAAPDAVGAAAGATTVPDTDDAAPSTTTTRPAWGPDGDAAGPVVSGDAEDDDGVPTALVAAALASLAVSGAAAGVAARSLGRRPGG